MDIFKKINKDITFNIRFIKRGIKGNAIMYSKVVHIEYGAIKHYNSIGYDCYFRPENNKFVFLDIDSNPTEQTINQLKKESILIINSSKGHYNVWFYCPSIKTKLDYETKSKNLVKKYNGDIGSAKINQISRIPINGLINHKPEANKFKIKVIHKNYQIPKVPIIKEYKLYSPKSKFKKKVKPKKFNKETKKPLPSPSSSGVINQRGENKRAGSNQTNNKNKPESIHSTKIVSSGQSDRNDYAFIRHIIQNKQNKTKQDLINLLIKQSPRGQDLNYITRTVTNVMSRFG